MRPAVAACVIGALVVAACSGDDDAGVPSTTEPGSTSSVAERGPSTTPPVDATTTTTEPLDQSLGPVAAPVRHPATARPIYFVMTDRFENGDPTNDTAGIDGGPLDHGFEPTNRAYHHGGDLAGLTARLPYLDELGIGAIWITPPFTNRYVQGDGTVEGSSSSYHGYWQIDFDHVDPHLGTEEEMRAFVDAAHELDIDVYFDIVVNHTGDVIRYADDSYVYYSQAARPYVDASGEVFDPADFVDDADFPELDPATSFPHVPTFADPADATAKSPDWLNDRTLYHNRGNSTFQGESDTFGDFYGLDDLFTEHPRVVDGMIDLYADVIERYDIDGFRVDTMKHVNIEFWERFVPAIRERAAALGKPDFFVFGEVFNEDPIQQSSFTNIGVSSTLDFIVAGALERALTGGDGVLLTEAFDDDDWFTDADGNASMQVTFFGNHDMGRMGYLLRRSAPSASAEDELARAELGLGLLFLARGAPVVYYGDEQGFVGSGGDQLARQDMFPSLTADYVDDANRAIGSDTTPGTDNFDTAHPLYRWIRTLTELRRGHPALVTGAHIVHGTDAPVASFSRIDREERIEYVVVANPSEAPVSTSVATLSADTEFELILGSAPASGPVVRSDGDGGLVVDVSPLGLVVLRATEPVVAPDDAPEVAIVRPEPGTEIPTVRYRLEAALADDRYAEVTFAVSIDGAEPVVVGVDDAPPYRVYWSTAAVPDGAEVDVIATVDDGTGRRRSDVSAVVIGSRT